MKTILYPKKQRFLLYNIVAFSLLSFNIDGQNICNSSGNLVIFTNYDGGNLTINIDQNIANLKIGICSYEACAVTLTGAFAGNVTEVRYAG